MELISLPVSPFSARVRIGIYAKGLNVTVALPPAGWPHSSHYRTINPIGRVPVLICEDGTVIPESQIILEYLEERFPDARPLLPSTLNERARVRLLARMVDLYLMPSVVALANARLEERAVRLRLEELHDALSALNELLEGAQTYAVGEALSLADCALVPALFAVVVTGKRLECDLLAGADLVAHYLEAVQGDDHLRRVWLEMTDGLRRPERIE